MSYILDALKKAEAERNLGTVPTIHAQPVIGAASRDRTSIWRRPWLWIALGLTAIVLITIGWYMSVNTIESLPKPTPEQAATIVSPPVASPPITPPPLAAAEPVPIPIKPKRPKDSAAIASPPVQKKTVPTPTVTKSPEEKPVPTLFELPEQIQREIPQLVVGGYIYSPNQAERFILVNKKLLHEGDQIAPELTLEKMLPNGLIFNYKGYRYRRSY